MLNSIIPISVFIFITLVYFILIFIKGESMVFDVIYYSLIVGTQVLFVYLASKSLCGSAQISSVFTWGIVPWIFIFISINIILKMFPGWKAPFSNTFGYGIVNLMGIKNTVNTILKSNFKSSNSGLNKIAEKMFQDESLLINEMTPVNFDSALQKLKPLLDTGNAGYKEALDKLRHLVRLKDEISRGIWYILSGLLTISVSNMGIASSGCVKTAQQIKEEVSQYHKQMNDAHEEQKNSAPPKKYIIRD